MSTQPHRASEAAEPSDATSELARLRAEAEAATANLVRLEAEYEALLADSGVIQEDRDTHRLLVERARAAATSAQAALQRHESGSYGACQSCGEPIPAARLEAVPDAVRCVTCEGRA